MSTAETPRRAPNRPRRSVAVAVVTVLAVALTGSLGCSGDGDPHVSQPPRPTPPPAVKIVFRENPPPLAEQLRVETLAKEAVIRGRKARQVSRKRPGAKRPKPRPKPKPKTPMPKPPG